MGTPPQDDADLWQSWLAETAEFPVEQPAFEIETIDLVKPLAAEINTLEVRLVSEQLTNALFGSGAAVYWVADPTSYGDVIKNGYLDSSRHSVTALCPDGMFEIEEAAPRLIGPIDLKRTDAVIQNALGECLGKRVGLFLVGDVEHNLLAQHLRRFVCMPAEGLQKRLFLRFWDPFVALDFLRINERRPERIGRFLGVPDGPTLSLFAETGPSEMKAIHPSEDIQRTGGDPELDAEELAKFDSLKTGIFVRNTANWLIKTFGGEWPRTQIEAEISEQIAPLRALGISSEYATNFVLAGLYIFGSRVTNMPEDGQDILSNRDNTEDVRARDFLRWAQNHPNRRSLNSREGA